MPINLKKFNGILESAGIHAEVKQFPDSTRTALEAANVIGCSLGRIAKSLVFKSKNSGKPILIIASGSNRVDEKKIKVELNQEIEKADADFVLNQTGFIIGGVPPFGHKSQLTTLIDHDLLQYTEVWAAAGTPYSVFKIKPEELVKITNGKTAEIKYD